MRLTVNFEAHVQIAYRTQGQTRKLLNAQENYS